MTSNVKIAIIGAGSAQFSLDLVRDLCLTPNMAGSLVSLMDVNEERLDKIHNVAARYANELGFDLRFEKTLSREAALKDTDYILNTASVGPHGAGGIASVHNIRFMLAVAKDAEKYCPNAWLIQSGNPVFEGCTAMTRQTSLKVLGLCHGHLGIYDVARTLGMEIEHVGWQAAGFNHVIYLTHFYYKGKDAYPLLDQWIETQSEQYWSTHKPAYYDNQMSPAAIEQYKMIGYMPIGDTPRGGGWWYHRDQSTKKKWFGGLGGWDSKEGWVIYVKELEDQRTKLFQVANDPKAKVTEAFPAIKSHEQIVPIIDGLTNDVSGYFQVNIPNNGLISGIPDDVVVEVPGWVSKRGVQGIQVGKMPESVMSQILWHRLGEAERAIDLALHPSRGQVLNLILYRHTNLEGPTPPVASYEDAEEVLEKVLQADPELAAILS